MAVVKRALMLIPQVPQVTLVVLVEVEVPISQAVQAVQAVRVEQVIHLRYPLPKEMQAVRVNIIPPAVVAVEEPVALAQMLVTMWRRRLILLGVVVVMEE